MKFEYLNNPCKTSSLPFYKRNISFPKNVCVFHMSDYNENNNYRRVDKYFKLKHDLRDIRKTSIEAFPIEIKEDINDLVDMINESYEKEGIIISRDYFNDLSKSTLYRKNLWLKIVDSDKNMIASLIALYDGEINEGVVDFIQVLPKYRGLGYARELLLKVLNELRSVADFVTVSGRVENQTNPKKLYESVGFTGDDIWYVCIK